MQPSSLQRPTRKQSASFFMLLLYESHSRNSAVSAPWSPMSSFSDQLGYCSLLRLHGWETAPWEKAKANAKLCFLTFEKHSPVIALCLKTVISYILFSNMTIFKWKVESCYSAPTRSTILCFCFNQWCWKFLVALYFSLATLCTYCEITTFMIINIDISNCY